MLRFLNLPILFPVLMGLGLLILHPESRKHATST
jgi:multicomponent Na+:H+ antiporter subunit D